MSAREAVLERIRDALGPAPDVPEVPREYRPAEAAARGAAEVVERFCERVADYRATVTRVRPVELEQALLDACERRGTTRVAAAAGAPWRPPGLEIAEDDPRTPPTELDGVDAALTGCALGIAETGTIVLDGGPESGRRALTLVPDHHLCVIGEEQVVASVPDAIGELHAAATEGRPITLVSGPSATSDIELERVEGVHGPRMLDVFVVAPGASEPGT